MATIREDGSIEKRTVVDLHDRYLRALRAVFGEAYDTQDGNPIVDLGKAFALLGVVSQEDEMVDIYRASRLSGARGSAVDELVDIAGGGERVAASQSTGLVQITLASALASPSPLWEVGDIWFVDAAGNEYDLTEDVLPNGTVDVVASVHSRGTGADKNIGVNEIVGVRHANDAEETFWNANVAGAGTDFTNASAFSGGNFEESDSAYVARVLAEDASNRSGSTPGIAQAILDFGGASYARVYANENPTLGQSRGLVLSPGASSANSGLINAAGGAGVNTRIAVKKVIATAADRRWLQHFAAIFNHNSGTPTFTVRIEGDTAGSPSGVLIDNNYLLTGYTPTDDVETASNFALGAYPAASDDDLPITIWLVFTATSGSAYLRGDTGGAAGDVKVYRDGAWNNDANINRAAVKLYDDIPPGGYRAIVIGGTANEIAQAIDDYHPAGITNDGSSVGTANRDGVDVERRYEVGSDQDLEILVEVRVNSLYQGGTDAIKNILVRYVGGTDTEGEERVGLNIGQDFETDAAKALFFDTDIVTGIVGFNFLKVSALGGTPTEQATLSPDYDKKFTLDPANVTVTIV